MMKQTKIEATSQTEFVRVTDEKINEVGQFSGRILRELHLEYITAFDVTVILKADFREDDRLVTDGGLGITGEVLGWLYGAPESLDLNMIVDAVYHL